MDSVSYFCLLRIDRWSYTINYRSMLKFDKFLFGSISMIFSYYIFHIMIEDGKNNEIQILTISSTSSSLKTKKQWLLIS